MLASLLLTGLVVFACGSEGALGEDCDEEGVQDGECTSGLVCGKATDAALVCQTPCKEQSDCPANSDCNGISGDTKACRVKK